MADYTRVNLNEVEDLAARHGFGDRQEARFPREALGLEASAMAQIVVKPGQRQPFAHRHDTAEEVHVIVSGSGRLKVDEEIVDVAPQDVIRIGPHATRQFEAGPEGLAYVVFSPRAESDAEIVQGFWES